MASRLEAGIDRQRGRTECRQGRGDGRASRCRSSRASAASSSSRRATSFDDMPLIVDPSGIYVRPEGSVYITGGAEPEDGGRPGRPAAISSRTGRCSRRSIWPVLATRIPAFEAIKATRAWAGHYDYNTLDQNGVIGPHPEVHELPLRQRLFRPRPAAGAGGRQGARRTDRAWRLPHGRLLGLRLRAHRRRPAVSRAQRHLSAPGGAAAVATGLCFPRLLV